MMWKSIVSLLVFFASASVAAEPCPATIDCPAESTLVESPGQLACVADGRRHGLIVQCTGNGVLYRRANYDQGLLHGREVYLAADGTERTAGFHVKGKRHGDWLEDPDPGPARGSYQHGKRHGSWEYYDQKGQLIAQKTFADGVEHGEFMHRDGKFVERGAKIYGALDGQWVKRHGKTVVERKVYDHGMLIESCRRNGGELRCRKHDPWRHLNLKSCQPDPNGELRTVAGSEEALRKKLPACEISRAIDWKRHRVFVGTVWADEKFLSVVSVRKRPDGWLVNVAQARSCGGVRPLLRWVPIAILLPAGSEDVALEVQRDTRSCGRPRP